MNEHFRGQETGRTMTAGGALLARLKSVGVDYIFANSGTDFPPIIEGLAEAEANNIDLPVSLIMPHEGAAMGMAHGYYLATGRPAAVSSMSCVDMAPRYQNCFVPSPGTSYVPVRTCVSIRLSDQL